MEYSPVLQGGAATTPREKRNTRGLMDANFPAAHSMDTTWYAIDRDGHVASFSSGEAGAVPVAALAAIRSPASAVLDRAWWDDPGLFHYEHARRFEEPWQLAEGDLWVTDGPRLSGPYIRDAAPVHPLHVDQLPPNLRAFLATTRFAGLSFADEQALQPAEHFPCASEQPEYLTLAGERRPFPEPPPEGH
jgi:hypothetical protein